MAQQNSHTEIRTGERLNARTRALAPAALAFLFGTFLSIGVGFAGPDAIHNAAHDARHAFAFPCH